MGQNQKFEWDLSYLNNSWYNKMKFIPVETPQQSVSPKVARQEVVHIQIESFLSFLSSILALILSLSSLLPNRPTTYHCSLPCTLSSFHDLPVHTTSNMDML